MDAVWSALVTLCIIGGVQTSLLIGILVTLTRRGDPEEG